MDQLINHQPNQPPMHRPPTVLQMFCTAIYSRLIEPVTQMFTQLFTEAIKTGLERGLRNAMTEVNSAEPTQTQTIPQQQAQPLPQPQQAQPLPLINTPNNLEPVPIKRGPGRPRKDQTEQPQPQQTLVNGTLPQQTPGNNSTVNNGQASE